MLGLDVLDCFGEKLKFLLQKEDWEGINEIRVRTGRAVILKKGAEEFFIGPGGLRTKDIASAYRADRADVEEMVNMISCYSLYAFSNQLKEGFITVPGGHRAGLAGSAVTDGREIGTIKNISSAALRIASQRKGCASGLVKNIFSDGLKSVLIVSPVCGGKTTMLRDVLRILSDGGYTVGLSDERGEIAACYMGEPQLDIGERTDVLDCCPKAEGLEMLIRAMSPDIAAADEIGSAADIAAIERAALSGAKVICTAHGENMEAVKKKFGNSDIFERYVFLEGRTSPGKIKEIYDGGGELLWRSK